LRYRPAARQPQMIDTDMSHTGFRCMTRDTKKMLWLKNNVLKNKKIFIRKENGIQKISNGSSSQFKGTVKE
jgi:hypothetical protein